MRHLDTQNLSRILQRIGGLLTESSVNENIKKIEGTGIACCPMRSQVGYEHIDTMYEHLANDLL